MTVMGPRVRDLSSKKRGLTVDVVSGPAFELLASAFVITPGEYPVEEYEAGPALLERARATASPQLLAELKGIGRSNLWLGLMGQAYDAPEPRDVGTFLDYVASVEPGAVLRDLVIMAARRCETPPELIDRVAAGDPEALERLAGLCDEEAAMGLRSLLSRPPAETVGGFLGWLRRFDDEVFHGGEGTAAALARDAAEKEALAATMPPERLVETATNGITFTVRPEVSGIVLVPSAATRPWVAYLEHGSLSLFVYPVAEEVLNADPDAPSPWMLRFYKALADESRLRILNMLAGGPASLSQVAERLGLAKSTVFHHVRALRAAGLVLITVGAEKEYSLRSQAIPEASRMLQAYLSSSAGGEGLSAESGRTK